MNGEFETHLTLAPLESAQVEQLRAFAAERGLKISHIVLSQGAQISQPMLTFHRRGALPEVQAEADRYATEFAAVGHEVRRPRWRSKPLIRWRQRATSSSTRVGSRLLP